MTLLSRHRDVDISWPRQLVIDLETAFFRLFLPGVVAGTGVRLAKMALSSRKAARCAAIILCSRLVNTGVILVAGRAALALSNPAGVIWG